MSRRRRYLWTTVTSLIVVAAAGAPFLFRSGAFAAAEAPAPPPGVEEERRYYVALAVVEATPKRNGKKWDLDGSAPDLYYEVHWQGHRVFKSSKKADTLVAKWSNVAVDLGDLLKSVSLDESIQAARITAREGGTVRFIVYDADVGGDDVVAEWTVPVAQLEVGDQTWTKPAGSLVGAVCRVLPLDGVEFETLTR